MHFFSSTLMLKNNYSNYVLIVNLIHILLRTSRKPRPLSYESIVVIGKPHVSYRNAASENLMKKFRTRFVLLNAGGEMELTYVKLRVVRGGWHVVYAICICTTVCIHSRGEQTDNYLKRARPGIRICSFVRIILNVP